MQVGSDEATVTPEQGLLRSASAPRRPWRGSPARLSSAGYSVMYAATVGYAASATFAGVVQSAASPSAAILAEAGLTLLLTMASASGELASQRGKRVPA